MKTRTYKTLHNFTIETFRRGYCERYIIQAYTIKEAQDTILKEQGINTDFNKDGNGYFVFE